MDPVSDADSHSGFGFYFHPVPGKVVAAGKDVWEGETSNWCLYVTG
jgi:hypothetical protein